MDEPNVSQCELHRETIADWRRTDMAVTALGQAVAVMQSELAQSRLQSKKDIDAWHEASRRQDAQLVRIVERLDGAADVPAMARSNADRLQEMADELRQMDARLIRIEGLAEARAGIDDRVKALEAMAHEAKGTMRGLKLAWAAAAGAITLLGAAVAHYASTIKSLIMR